MPATHFSLPLLPVQSDQPLPWKFFGKNEHQALGTLARYDGMLLASSNAELFRNSWLMKEAQSSTMIEGTVTTLVEDFAENAGIALPVKRRDDVQDVLNYRAAMFDGSHEILQGRPISLSLIKTLHATLLNGARGKQKSPGAFRNIQVHIGSPGEPLENASYISPNPVHVQNLLDNWLQFLKRDNINPAIQTAVMHAQFEMIHPFLDGNGRMGRLLITLFLTYKSILSKPCFYMSSYLQSNRKQYYQTLNTISKNGDWNPWIQFFLEGIIQHCETNTQLLRKMTDLYETSKSTFSNATNSSFAISILDYVFRSPIFTIPDLLKHNPNISRQLGVDLVAKLLDAKVIEKIQEGRGRKPAVYRFNDLMALLS